MQREGTRRRDQAIPEGSQQNRFKKHGPNGYRDMLINVEIDGMIGEIQVHLPEMFRAKEKPQQVDGFVRPVSGHDLWVMRTMVPEDSPIDRRLLALSRRLYNSAYEAAMA